MKDIDRLAKEELKSDKVVQQIWEEEKGPAPFTDAEIDDMLLEVDKIAEDQYELDYSVFSLYMYENQPICPYCNSVLTFFDGSLYCDTGSCFTLDFKVPIRNIADVAWQMKYMHDVHKDSECKAKVEFLISSNAQDLLFANCEKCKYLNYIKIT